MAGKHTVDKGGMHKRVLLLILTATMFLVCGCGKNGQQETGAKNKENLQGNDMESGTGEESEMVSKEPSASAPSVYMTTDISPEGLGAVYEALEASPSGNVAVKLSTGETGSNYLRTALIGDLMQSLNAVIVECNTAYGGTQANTAMHFNWQRKSA